MSGFTFDSWGDGQGGVPAGTYQGVFRGVTPVAPNEEKGYGAGVCFAFEVTQEGEHKGKTPSRIVSKSKPSPKNALGRMLVALIGRTPEVGETPDIEGLIGKPYMLIVSARPNGGTRVETVSPLG